MTNSKPWCQNKKRKKDAVMDSAAACGGSGEGALPSAHPNGITLPKVATKEDILGDDAVIYNLQGQRVSPTTKSIVISRGRKLLKQ
jgi:hypothetical protein